MNNEIKSINPESLKKPTKAYSQGVLIPLGNAEILFVTGQIAQDIDGNAVAPNDAKAQTELVTESLPLRRLKLPLEPFLRNNRGAIDNSHAPSA